MFVLLHALPSTLASVDLVVGFHVVVPRPHDVFLAVWRCHRTPLTCALCTSAIKKPTGRWVFLARRSTKCYTWYTVVACPIQDHPVIIQFGWSYFFYVWSCVVLRSTWYLVLIKEKIQNYPVILIPSRSFVHVPRRFKWSYLYHGVIVLCTCHGDLRGVTSTMALNRMAFKWAHHCCTLVVRHRV